MTASIDAASGVTTQSIGKINGKYRTNKSAIVSRSSYGYEPQGLKRPGVAGRSL